MILYGSYSAAKIFQWCYRTIERNLIAIKIAHLSRQLRCSENTPQFVLANTRSFGKYFHRNQSKPPSLVLWYSEIRSTSATVVDI